MGQIITIILMAHLGPALEFSANFASYLKNHRLRQWTSIPLAGDYLKADHVVLTLRRGSLLNSEVIIWQT